MRLRAIHDDLKELQLQEKDAFDNIRESLATAEQACFARRCATRVKAARLSLLRPIAHAPCFAPSRWGKLRVPASRLDVSENRATMVIPNPSTPHWWHLHHFALCSTLLAKPSPAHFAFHLWTGCRLTQAPPFAMHRLGSLAAPCRGGIFSGQWERTSLKCARHPAHPRASMWRTCATSHQVDQCTFAQCP